MPSAIVVRGARADDLAAVAALLIAQLRDHGNALPDAALEAAARGMLERPQRGRLLLACDGHIPVGFAALSFLWTLEQGGRAAWLDELYVLPARRAAGIGGSLLAAAIDLARAEGARAIDLEIAAGHDRAASLYQRHGFMPLSRQRWALRLAAPAAAADAAASGLRGGCACGAVRYAIDAAPVEVCHCHCRMCQRTSGAPVVTWLTVPRAALRLVRGAPRQRRSSATAGRGFCADCGTALTFRADARPDVIDVTVASLDHPERVAPRQHIFTASALPWLRLDDELPRHDGRAPERR